MVNKEWNRELSREVITIIIARDTGNLEQRASNVGGEWLSYSVIL